MSEAEGGLRGLKEFRAKAVLVVALLMVGVTFYSLLIFPIDPWVLRIAHLCLAMVLVFLTKPFTLRSFKGEPVDLFLSLLAIIVAGYLIYNSKALLDRIVVEPTTLDIMVGVLGMLVILEAIRRTLGSFFCYLTVFFVLYAKFGDLIPGVLGNRGYSFSRIIGFLQTTDGVYSIPLGVSATYVLLFVVFGAFLNGSGAGKLFIDLALRIAGAARGGPAKVAVIASSLFGTISGAAVANVVSIGVFTIPLMKKIGYRASYAGAIEAVASSGGQIMPPVMGAGAFVMAEIIGRPYADIMLAAIIPAVLYYAALFLTADAVAVKDGLHGLPKQELPKVKQIMSNFYLIAPLVVLILVLLVMHQSVIRAAFWGIAVTIIISWLKTETRMGLRKIVQAMQDGALNVVTVATSCAAAGVIIGVIALTGLGIKLANAIISLSGGSLSAALVLSAVISLILGMGLPTVAAYIIAASVVCPPLIELGLTPLVAHLFVFYFATISTITPPVCVAAFAAAGIAQESPMKVGFQAFKIGLSAFIIPFMFVYGPQLLLIGNPGEIIWRTFMALFGVALLVTAVEGYFPVIRKSQALTIVQRIIFFFGSLMFIIPVYTADLLGFGLFILGVLSGWVVKKGSDLEGFKNADA